MGTIEIAQKDADRICQAALAQIPDQYHAYVMLLPQRKRVGGTRERPVWAEIHYPYVPVAGRLKMATDAHHGAGATLALSTTFDMVEGTLVCRALVQSSLHGSAVAHATVLTGQSGPAGSTPLEVAETSAIGRALGFLGYGLLGTSGLGAEEVEAVTVEAEPAVLPPATQEAPENGTDRGAVWHTAHAAFLQVTKDTDQGQVVAWIRDQFPGAMTVRDLTPAQLAIGTRRWERRSLEAKG